MPRITNWIVWGSIIYLNTKMYSYSLLFYEVSTLILKYIERFVVKRKCFGKTKMNSDCWAFTTQRDSYFTGRHRTRQADLLTPNHLCHLYEEHWTGPAHQAQSISHQHARATRSHRLQQHVSKSFCIIVPFLNLFWDSSVCPWYVICGIGASC